MASYRPFPPPPRSTFGPPPAQNPLPPPPLPLPLPPPSRGNQYPQNWGYSGGDRSSFSQNYSQIHQGSSFPPGGYSSSSQHYGTQIPHPPHQYSYPPPPPPPESSYPPPPPPSISQNSLNLPTQPAPAPIYYPSSQYSQFNHQSLQSLQPPPPPSPPPSSSIPPPPPPPSQPPSPPPPPSLVPSVSQSKESKPAGEKRVSMDIMDPHKPFVPLVPARKSNGASGRIETEEERRLRKKRELEKQRQEEKHRQQLKESQNKVLQKTQMLSSGMKGHGSISGSHMGERRATPFLSGERTENRLKKPTTFICKLK